jgi:hypothetical protein
MPRDDAPPEITALADARAEARRARDWAAADGLLARIAAAGWKVIDTGTMYDLVRAAPPDVTEDGVTRYGSSVAVPSRLDEAPVGVATVVLVAPDRPDDLARTMRALVAHAPDGTQVVVVANGADGTEADALAVLGAAEPGAPGVATEVLRTSGRLGWATALNAGIRRAVAPVVILLDAAVELRGDLVSALAASLHDERIAVAGPWGLASDDMHRFRAAPEDAAEVVAIDGGALAFRREDYGRRGPLDEHFAVPPGLDVWWSLVLRDVPADADAADGGPGGAASGPRRAVRVGGEHCVRHPGSSAVAEGGSAERQARRNHYRVLKQFATRRDLLPG